MRIAQQGTALLVSMLVLSVMTLLGISTLRSTNTQQTILRNNQLTLIAKNTATSEINAQLRDIAENDLDPVVQLVLNSGEGQAYDVKNSTVNGIGLKGQQTKMNQELTMTLLSEAEGSAPPGYTLSLGNNRVKTLRIEMQSEANLPDSASKSVQLQGYYYLVPSAN